ncbi:MAG: alkane 1-monooxygenase [Gammaproteobacteria bacterium]|nr:alkane 1-monooxygenase [Gammaproteobacteria bacterium]NND38282.1 alkane 1-monooxygenase [Pseudomonadales bacterium]MBT8151293.1 alkane 1-monooxygenase [Gammaproteobacteria bacterium]NNL10590.1 alkane 1-monooxygenase [Pseudomonadales bacterium]NNM11490.1 alkane 1-monooxygenase [Pseudomonadales bacterium]
MSQAPTDLSADSVAATRQSNTLNDPHLLWMLSPVMPLLPVAAIALYLWSGSVWLLALPLLMGYLILPIVDLLVGEDHSNVDSAKLDQLQEDPYFRYLTYLAIPSHFITLLALAWFVGTQPQTWLTFTIAAITAGGYSGLAINTAHELGHKDTKLERLLARIVLALPGYGHFCIEHNAGHHRDVATPEDVASSRMGESFYRFILREIPGTVKRGWEAEKKRLQRRNNALWSWHNEILQSYAISAALYVGLIAAFGAIMLPFLLINCVWAYLQLSSANYIEHYGLLREKNSDGRYEWCKPHHSWNANSIFSNLALFQLERHSDHHANPTRRYQSLRNFHGAPQLPTGYFGMYLVAYIPQLWYKVMDQRLLAVPHIAGDLDKVNIDPARRKSIYKRYAPEQR